MKKNFIGRNVGMYKALLIFALFSAVLFFQGCVSGGGGFSASGPAPAVSVTPNATIAGYLYDDAAASPILYAGAAASRAVIVVAETRQYTVMTDTAGFFKADIQLSNPLAPVIVKFQKKDSTLISGEYMVEKGGVYYVNAFIEGSARLKVNADKLYSFVKVEHPDNLKIEFKKVLDERQKTASAVTVLKGRVVVTASHVNDKTSAEGVINTTETASLPIAGVLVTLTAGITAATDVNGFFSIPCDLKAGNYSLSFKKAGYPDRVINFVVESKDYAVGVLDFFAEMESGLRALTLSKTNDNISENTTYNLLKVKTIASYSDGSTREVSASWTAAEGSILNSIYTPPAGKKGLFVLTAKYSEGTKSETALLTISVNAILTALNLNKTSETVEANVPYDLKTAKPAATYSDFTTREVIVTWTADRGSISGFSYIPPAGYLGEVNLTASYTEGTVVKTAALKLSLSRVGKSIILSKSKDEVPVGSTYKLAEITATINYSDKTSRVITPVWSYSGADLGDQKSFTTPGSPQNLILKASFTEDGLTQTAYLELKIKPQIISLSSYSGVAGELITITGKGFGASRGESLIKFNQKYASELDIQSWSDSVVIVKVPAASMPGDLTITVNQIQSNAVRFDTSYIASISPAAGTAGTIVSITGSGFGASKGSSKLKFNGVEAVDIVSWSNAKIVARVPYNALNGPVYVELNGLQTNSVAFGLTSITSISPAIVKPGDKIVIDGNGFGPTQESSVVKFNGVPASEIIRWSDNLIETAVPQTAKTGYLTVTVNGILSNSYKYDITTITSLNPYYGPSSSVVELIGDGFGDFQGTSSVSLGSVQANNIISWSNNKIKIEVPSGAVTGKISLKINGVNYYSDKNFEVTRLASIDPPTSAIGSIVNISGEGFGPSGQSSAAIKFGDITAGVITNWTSGKISVKVPTGAVSSAVKIIINGIASNTVHFSVTNISSISPARGVIGTLVTINGSSFGSAAGTVKFNGVDANEIISWTDAKIIVKVPAGATSGSVSVTSGGFVNNGFNFEVLNVLSVSPSLGTLNDILTISGSGFGSVQAAGSVVKFGSVGANNIISWSDAQILVKVPEKAVSSNVTVTVGGTVSNGAAFSVVLISSLSQNYGPEGMALTVNGSGFGPSPDPAKVMFGETEAVNISLWTDTKIMLTVPAGSVSSDVKVVSGPSSSNPIYFEVTKIASANPLQGTEGAQIVINGAGFGPSQNNSSVNFNGVSAGTITSWSGDKIIAAVPSGTSSGSVNVVIGGTSSNSVPLSVISINSLSLLKANINAQVTINGTGFGADQGVGSVEFNGVAAPIDLWSDKIIVARVPSGAVSGYVKVKTSNIITNGIYFDVILLNSDTPVMPKYGPPGTLVTVNGSMFGASQSGSSVKFNGTAATVISKWSNTQIAAKVPASAVSGKVSVNVSGFNVTNDNAVFEVTKINSIAPAYGPPGTIVTISGGGFGEAQGGSSVKFNNMAAPASDYISWSSVEIIVKTPLSASSGILTVNIWGSDAPGINYKVTNITSVSPHYGPAGTPVTFNGVAFGTNAGTVKFNDTFATNIVSWSDNNIVTTVPEGASSGDILISIGGIDNAWSAFKVTKISSIAPQYGPAGTTVSVSGTGFGATRGASSISFNGMNASSIVSWSDDNIVAIVPSGASSGNVRINIGGHNSAGVNFNVTSLSSVAPLFGPPGTAVTVNGSSFGANSLNAGIYFNNVLAETSLWSDTKVVAIVPQGATAGDIIIKVNGIESNGLNFDVSKISLITPEKGTYGTAVTINGTGFGPLQGTSKIKFNSIEANVVFWSNQQVIALAPPGAIGGFVTADIGGILTNSAAFSVIAISSLTPYSGTYDTNVTINGTGFGSAQGSGKVKFAGADADNILLWTDSQIITKVPIGASSGGITVVGDDGISSNSFNFSILAVEFISPPIIRAGIPVAINGKGFGTTSSSGSVKFNGISAASIVSWTDTKIDAVSPSGITPGNVSVTVNGIKSNDYYYDVLNINSILPNNFGQRGTQININGTGFGSSQGGSSVAIGGVQMSVIQGGWTNNQITATVPTNSLPGNLAVTVSGVESNLLWFEVALDYTVMASLPSFGGTGNGDGKLNDAYDVFRFTDSSSTTYYYVADTSNNRVQIFNDSGVMELWIGKGNSSTGVHGPLSGETPVSGNGSGEFNMPKGIVVDANENIYVVDSGNNRIQKFNSDGSFNKSWGNFGSMTGEFRNPSKIAIDNQNKIYVADTGNHRVQIFSLDGTYIRSIGMLGSGDGSFSSPEGVAIDKNGNIYVADTGNYRVQKFDANGVFLAKFGSEGENNGEFRNPCALCVDSHLNVLVVDSIKPRVQKFSPDGLFISVFGNTGALGSPVAITLNGDSKFIVSDTASDRIVLFERE